MIEIHAERAQRLVDEGRVEITFSDGVAIYGRVRAERANYIITLYHSGRFRCGCKLGRQYSYTDDLCVHALAVRLAAEEAKREERRQ